MNLCYRPTQLFKRVGDRYFPKNKNYNYDLFYNKYRDLYFHDFVNDTRAPRTMQDTSRQLEKWKNVLSKELSKIKKIPFHKKSKILSSFTSTNIEIFGQYQSSGKPNTMDHNKLYQIDSHYTVVYRPGLSKGK